MTSVLDQQGLSPQAEWLGQFFAAIDRMDAPAFAQHFEASNGSFRFANHPPLSGQEAIAQGCAGILGLLERIRHDVIRYWVAGDDFLVEGQVHYRRHDGFELSVPFLSVFEFVDDAPGLIQSYRVFVDSHELFQSAQPQ